MNFYSRRFPQKITFAGYNTTIPQIRQTIIRFLLAGLAAGFWISDLNAQEDTTSVHRYIVKKKGGSASANGIIVTPNSIPPDGCVITGQSTVTGGNSYSYLLNCSDGSIVDFWEVTCGVAVDWYDNVIVIQWNSSGCTTGTIKARKDAGAILATKSVTITPAPPPTITYSSLFTSSNFTKTIDLTKPVGTVMGSAGTTPSGGVTYSIPVYAPPGTNGFQPAIGIAYNSQASAGVVGWGWSISGLSVISRTGKNIYHNGIPAPVSYTSSDAFLLDGSRLNAITGSNGANGTIYAGEAESFAKIISNTSGSANNPDWFKVTAKDGSIMEFGHTTDSRVLTDNGLNVILWRLNRIQDINSNYIDFVYDNAGRDSRIKTIKYTGNINTGLVPYNSLSFNYKLRADKNTWYDAGGSLTSQYLLDKITVFADDDIVVKNYQFNYGFDNVSSFLKEVVESAGDGASFNSTIFLYGDQPQSISNTSSTALTGEYDLFAGDYDADGKTDLLAAKSYYDDNVKTRLHTEYSLLSEINGSGGSVLYIKTLPQNVKAEIFKDKKTFNFLSSDYNGDGRDDVLHLNTSVENLNCQAASYYFRKLVNTTVNYTKAHNAQTGWTDYQEVVFGVPTDGVNSYQNIHSSGNFFIPGDFDGDGSQDYILIVAKKRQSGVCGQFSFPFYSFDYKAFFTSPFTNEINKEIASFGFGPNPDPAFYAGTVAGADMINVLDFDGDGKMEIIITKDGTTYVLNIQRTTIASGYYFAASVVYTTTEIIKDNRVFPGDFNGDKKTDLLVRNNSGGWKILYNTGTAFSATTFTFNQPVVFTGNYGDHILQIADFNGDGKSDIMHGYIVTGSSPTQSKLSFYYATGSLSTSPFYYEQYTYNKPLAYGKYGSSEGIVMGDFNGDGRTDLLNRYDVASPSDFISIKSFGKERMLAGVTDGHTMTTTFDYKLLTDKSTYPYVYDLTISLDDPANKNPFNYVQLPLYVASSMTEPDGIGGINTTTFKYENAVAHRTAKGFLGFKKVTAKNAVAGISSVSEYEINTQFVIPYAVKQTTMLTATSELLSETQITNSFVNLSTGINDKRYLQKIDKTLNIDYLHGNASESVNTFDSYGNITGNTSKTGILSGGTVTATETVATTTTYSIHNTPVAAKPDNVTVSSTRTGMPVLSAITAFTYTTNGLVASKTDFNGLPKAVTSSFTYNSFGNPLTVVTSSTGLNSRTATNTYDAKGRFALTKQLSGVNVSQTEFYTYASQWGQPLTNTSADCQTTLFEYDAFGRLKKTTLPQGFSVNNTLVWDVAGNNIWYSFTDHPGGKPDTKTWFDKLGRETKTQTAGFNNQWLTRLTTYNAKGQTATQTNDYYPAETPLTTTSTYDVYGRQLSSANTLNAVTSSYTKLSNGRMQVVVSNSSGQSSTRISDAAGKVITAIDNGGQLDFKYDSRGSQTEVKHGTNVLVTSVYDIYGRQTSLADKNAGTVTYSYDAYGQLTQQVDAKSNTYNMLYDDLGRITSRTGSEGATTFEYYKDVATGCNNNSPARITGFNGVVKEYTYDSYKRPATEKITIDGIAYTTSFTYNTYNALTKTVYPSAVEENKTYDANGGLLTVTGGNTIAPVTLFTATAVNGFGQYTGFTLGNGKTSQHTYNYGTPTRYYTVGLQDLNLTFDYTKGNLLTRRDAIKNITENFTFDNLNRLLTATVNGTQQFAIGYDGNATSSMGNIVTKTDAGNYVYKTDKIHAVAYIINPAGAQTPPANISTTEQQITYTAFLKTATITEAPYSLEFTYGPDYERVKTVLKNNNVLQETRLYMGSYEKQIIAGGVTREIHYIGGGNGICAILVKEAGVVTPYYTYTDQLGSIVTVTNAAGAIVAEQNFDAWGRKRNPANWQYASVPATPLWLYRGYTGHEQLPLFALINMNGRMYDPIQGRMLSPDNYVADLFNTQSYNRYGYANNNPLSYIDPDGNNPLLIAAIAGALAGGYMKGIQYASMGRSFWGGFWRGAIVGGASGSLAFLGGGSFLANVAWGVGEAVAINGLSNTLDGDPFFQGVGTAAIIGGAFAAFTSGIESFNNWKDGYGFGTNEGRLNLMRKEYANAVGTTSEDFAADRAIMFMQKRYGMSNKYIMTYNKSLGSCSGCPYAKTDMQYATIQLGPKAFASTSMLKATAIHEYGHVVRDRIVSYGDVYVLKAIPDPWNYEDGITGYQNEIINAGRMHISRSVLKLKIPLPGSVWSYGSRTIKDQFLVNPVWYARGVVKSKWFYLLPRRF